MKTWWVLVAAGYILAGVVQASLVDKNVAQLQIPQVDIMAPTATPTIALPVALDIPSINVTAAIEHVDTDEEGRMDVPSLDSNVAWYQLGSKPGESGNSVIDGHLDTPYGPSVFYDLAKLQPGDEIKVTDEVGIIRTFIVYEAESFAENEFPMMEVFGADPLKKLNLITCDGVFDNNVKSYSHRYVVFSVLKETP